MNWIRNQSDIEGSIKAIGIKVMSELERFNNALDKEKHYNESEFIQDLISLFGEEDVKLRYIENFFNSTFKKAMKMKNLGKYIND